MKEILLAVLVVVALGASGAASYRIGQRAGQAKGEASGRQEGQLQACGQAVHGLSNLAAQFGVNLFPQTCRMNGDDVVIDLQLPGGTRSFNLDLSIVK